MIGRNAILLYLGFCVASLTLEIVLYIRYICIHLV
jgi:hypothetical protein